MDGAVPIWGKPEDGTASDKPRKTTLFAEIAQLLARHGVAPGAYIDIADAALVTEDNLKALKNTLLISRLPATSSEGERGIAEAVAQEPWEESGSGAQAKPTQHRPAPLSKVAERTVTLDGSQYRAVVLHPGSQDQRRQQRFARELAAASAALAGAVGEAVQPEYCCRADAAAAGDRVRALPSRDHRVAVVIAERPTYGPGRPSPHPPRAVKAWRYR